MTSRSTRFHSKGAGKSNLAPGAAAGTSKRITLKMTGAILASTSSRTGSGMLASFLGRAEPWDCAGRATPAECSGGAAAGYTAFFNGDAGLGARLQMQNIQQRSWDRQHHRAGGHLPRAPRRRLAVTHIAGAPHGMVQILREIQMTTDFVKALGYAVLATLIVSVPAPARAQATAPPKLYNNAKQKLLEGKTLSSYTVGKADAGLYCEVAKHYDFVWF